MQSNNHRAVEALRMQHDRNDERGISILELEFETVLRLGAPLGSRGLLVGRITVGPSRVAGEETLAVRIPLRSYCAGGGWWMDWRRGNGRMTAAGLSALFEWRQAVEVAEGRIRVTLRCCFVGQTRCGAVCSAGGGGDAQTEAPGAS